MLYYDPDDRGNDRKVAAIAVVCYLAVFIALFFVVKFQLRYEAPEEGILVDFGNSETGFGEYDTMLADDASLPQSNLAPKEEEWMTQDYEEAPEVEQKKPEPSKKVEPSKNQATQSTQPKEEPAPREVNKRALFPGNTVSSSASAQGAAGGAGNQGTTSGTVADNYAGGGGTGNGISYSLAGRRPRGEFPRPSYDDQEQGKVVIEITVNASGNVVSATYRPSGSTTTNQHLIDAARRAALNAKFSESTNEIQSGTIEYVFKLK